LARSRKSLRNKTLLYMPFIPLVYFCGRPLSGPHFFRQAQTAWPIRMWDLHGFSLMPMLPTKGIAHQTWLLEFPLFQYFAFLVHIIARISVDFSVRFLALCFMIGSVRLVLREIFKRSNEKITVATYIAVLNPYMLYWGTTGLIDWMALFLTLRGFISTMSTEKGRNSAKWVGGILCILLAYVIKFPTALFGSLMILGHEHFDLRSLKSLQKLKNLRNWTIIVFCGGILVKIYGIFQSSLYPITDPRHVWDLNSAIYSWDFGTRDQYVHVLLHISEIYGRFSRTMSTPMVLALSLSIIFSLNRKFRYSIILLISSCAVYLAIFINLNLVHDYYQIPIGVVCSSILGFGVHTILDKISKTGVKLLVIFLIVIIPFLATFQDQTSRTYVKELFAKSHQTPGCPAPKEVRSPVLQIGNDDPEYFYACNLEGFILQTGEPSDVEVFNQEKTHYAYVYRQPGQRWNEVETALFRIGGKIKVISSQWSKISWVTGAQQQP